MSYCRYQRVHLISSFFSPTPSFRWISWKKRYNGWGVTLFDSLDTMWIMGLREDFEDAVNSIRDVQFRATKVRLYFSFFGGAFFALPVCYLSTAPLISIIRYWLQHHEFAPFFETTVRYLGGTLSAYALSGDLTLLRHAEKIAQILLPAFNGTESGLPVYAVNIETYVLGSFSYEVNLILIFTKFSVVKLSPMGMNMFCSQKRLLVNLISNIWQN